MHQSNLNYVELSGRVDASHNPFLHLFHVFHLLFACRNQSNFTHVEVGGSKPDPPLIYFKEKLGGRDPKWGGSTPPTRRKIRPCLDCARIVHKTLIVLIYFVLWCILWGIALCVPYLNIYINHFSSSLL